MVCGTQSNGDESWRVIGSTLTHTGTHARSKQHRGSTSTGSRMVHRANTSKGQQHSSDVRPSQLATPQHNASVARRMKSRAVAAAPWALAPPSLPVRPLGAQGAHVTGRPCPLRDLTAVGQASREGQGRAHATPAPPNLFNDSGPQPHRTNRAPPGAPAVRLSPSSPISWPAAAQQRNNNGMCPAPSAP